MAVATGTAAGGRALFDALISFLTTNVDLVAASQEWTIAWEAPAGAPNESDIVLRGPGLSGQDQVYIGLRYREDVPADSYWFELRGMAGVIPSAVDLVGHINVTPYAVRTFLDSGVISYWFVANGRRFATVLKISTVFEACYAGLILPYATPLAYPYPLFIGGSACPVGSGSPTSWRSELEGHSHFVAPYHNPTSFEFAAPGAWLLKPSGEWVGVATGGTLTDLTLAPTWFDFRDMGWFEASDTENDWAAPYYNVGRMMECYGGERLLIPYTLLQREPDVQTYGVLDGIFRCQGVSNAAENLISNGGVDHLVVQNAFRTSFFDYWALALE